MTTPRAGDELLSEGELSTLRPVFSPHGRPVVAGEFPLTTYSWGLLEDSSCEYSLFIYCRP